MSNLTHETVPTRFVEAEGIHYAHRRFRKTVACDALMLPGRHHKWHARPLKEPAAHEREIYEIWQGNFLRRLSRRTVAWPGGAVLRPCRRGLSPAGNYLG